MSIVLPPNDIIAGHVNDRGVLYSALRKNYLHAEELDAIRGRLVDGRYTANAWSLQTQGVERIDEDGNATFQNLTATGTVVIPLPPNVALTDAANVFTELQTFQAEIALESGTNRILSDTGTNAGLVGKDDPTSPTLTWELDWTALRLRNTTQESKIDLDLSDVDEPTLDLTNKYATMGTYEQARLRKNLLRFTGPGMTKYSQFAWDGTVGSLGMLTFQGADFTFDIGRDVYANGGLLKETLLSRTTSVGLNVTTKTTLFTVPGSSACLVTKMVVYDATGAIAAACRLGFGFNANADDVMSPLRMDEITGSTKYAVMEPDKGAEKGASTGTFGARCSVANGSARTVTVDVFGVLV